MQIIVILKANHDALGGREVSSHHSSTYPKVMTDLRHLPPATSSPARAHTAPSLQSH